MDFDSIELCVPVTNPLSRDDKFLKKVIREFKEQKLTFGISNGRFMAHHIYCNKKVVLWRAAFDDELYQDKHGDADLNRIKQEDCPFGKDVLELWVEGQKVR